MTKTSAKKVAEDPKTTEAEVPPVIVAPVAVPAVEIPPAAEVPPSATEQILSARSETALTGETVGEEVPLEKINRRLMKVGIGMGVLILVLVVGVYYLWSNLQAKELKQLESIVPSATPTATETPRSQFNRSETSVEVLNGSGKSGKAGEVAEALTALGYTADKVGNAPEEASTSMVYLSAKADLYKAEILGDLAEWGIKQAAELVGGTTEIKIILGADVK